MDRRIRFTAMAALVLGGCADLGPGTLCTTEARPGISLMLEDSVTGGAVQADVVTAVAVDNGWADSVTVSPASFESVDLAHERPGVYQLRVTAPGYANWVRQGVVVVSGECHVRTAELTARLQPSSP